MKTLGPPTWLGQAQVFVVVYVSPRGLVGPESASERPEHTGNPTDVDWAISEARRHRLWHHHVCPNLISPLCSYG